MGFSGRGSRNRIRPRRPPSCYRERQWHCVHFAAAECGAIEKVVKPSTQIADARVNVSQHRTAIAAAADSIHIGTTTARSTFCSECPGHASLSGTAIAEKKSQERIGRAPHVEFRWIAVLTLWTLLIGPMLDAPLGQPKVRSQSAKTMRGP